MNRTFPLNHWNPNWPTAKDNHPPCEACDLKIEDVPCSCGDYDDYPLLADILHEKG